MKFFWNVNTTSEWRRCKYSQWMTVYNISSWCLFLFWKWQQWCLGWFTSSYRLLLKSTQPGSRRWVVVKVWEREMIKTGISNMFFSQKRQLHLFTSLAPDQQSKTIVYSKINPHKDPANPRCSARRGKPFAYFLRDVIPMTRHTEPAIWLRDIRRDAHVWHDSESTSTMG